MAGLAGILRLDGGALDPSTDPILDAMGSAIAHRGLSSRRRMRAGAFGLVVPDRVEPSRKKSKYVVAFDGRPFAKNMATRHRRTAADAEALSSLYDECGAAMVERLDGRFALSVWDEHRRSLLLARDRLGVRPLYYTVIQSNQGRCLVFASEIKALLAHPDCPRDVDWLAALASQAMPRRTFGATSFFRGIEKLAPGTFLVADARTGDLAQRRYWRLNLPSAERFAADRRTDAEIVDGYRAALDVAVDLALGEHPDRAGLLLSGGIDSVSIAALAARRASIPTFTVLGQSTLGNGDARLAHAAATTLDLPIHPVIFRWHEPVTPDQWRRILWLGESPMAGAQHFYKFHLHRYAREACPHLDIMLNGEGSDEFSAADFRNHNQTDKDDASFEEFLAALADLQRDDLQSVETLAVETLAGYPIFTRSFLAASSGRSLPEHPWHRRIGYMLDGVDREVLWRDDRLAAGCGLASDAPFLDHALLEFVARIPPRAYGSLFLRKRMLREAMAGIVPEALRSAPKVPFFVGVDWHYTTRLLYDVLAADDCALVREAFDDRNHPVIAPGIVDALLEDCAVDPQRTAVGKLLPLVNLGLLERMARDAGARPGPAAAIQVLSALDAWDEERIEDLLADRVASIDRETVLAFAPGVEFVRVDTVDRADPPCYVLVDDVALYVIEDDDTRLWRDVLRRLDGVRPLGAILDHLGASLADVRRRLDEALDSKILVVSTASARGHSTLQCAAPTIERATSAVN